MKKIIITLIIFGILPSLPLASAVVLETGTIIEPSGSNTTYVMDNDISFTNVTINNDAPYFNGHIFQIEPDTGFATVKINSWNPPTMEFEVDATDEIVVVLGGFTFGDRHGIYIDGVHWQNRYVAAFGTLSFRYSHFSSHTFSVGDYVAPAPAGAYQPSEDEEYRPTAITPSYEEFDWTIILLGLGVIFIILIIIMFFCRKNNN